MESCSGNSLDFARQLQNDGALSLSRGDKKGAEHLYSKAHQVILATVGPLHRSVAESLLNLGAVKCSLGFNRQARQHFSAALKIASTTGPGDDPLCIATNARLANTYVSVGKLAKAELIYSTFLANQLNQPQTNYSAVAATRAELAHLYAEQGRMKKALKEIDCIRKIYDRMIENLSTSLPCELSAGIEHARLAYYFALSLSLQYFKDSAEATQAMLSYTFRRKILQIEFELNRQQLLIKLVNEPKFVYLKELDSVRRRLTNNTMSFSGKSEDIDIRYRQLQNDESQRQQLEGSLTRMLSKPSVINRLDLIDLDEVFGSLSPEETLIEFVKYRRYDFAGLQNEKNGEWQEYRYLAFVLKADSLKGVQLFDLGEAETIDRLVSASRAEMSKKRCFPHRGLVADDETASKTMHQSGIALRQRVFDPLVNSCASGPRLILAPDDALCTIPFGALPLDDGGGYLSDRFNIRYLNSGRELVKRQNVVEKPPSEPLVITDPACSKRTCKWSMDFFLKSRTVRLSKLHSFFTTPDKASLIKTGEESSGSHPAPLEVLPGAGSEAKIVADLLGVAVHRSLKTRKTLFRKGPSPRILHFATHGWFLPHEDRLRSELDSDENPPSRYAPIDNPMLRSAVLLADRQSNPPNPISAEQVLGLDLRSTELVVLSACDSGLGEIKTGEGVFGLRRAFMLVGAKAVIISLWQVADLPTTLLMAQFYRNFTRKRLRIDDSLHDAQKYLQKTDISEFQANPHTAEIIETICRKDPRVRKTVDWYNQQPQSFRPFADPFYWGGFIFVGRSASLGSRIKS